jgi:uncharacterized protein
VAFEADEYDSDSRTGWSVTAVGPAAVVTDRHRLDELMRLPVRPWAPGNRKHVVTISIDIVHGRRMVIKPPPHSDADRSYF